MTNLELLQQLFPKRAVITAKELADTLAIGYSTIMQAVDKNDFGGLPKPIDYADSKAHKKQLRGLLWKLQRIWNHESWAIK